MKQNIRDEIVSEMYHLRQKGDLVDRIVFSEESYKELKANANPGSGFHRKGLFYLTPYTTEAIKEKYKIYVK